MSGEPGPQIQGLDLFSGPWRFAQELEARFDTGILVEAVDRDQAAQPFPAEVIHQPGEDHLQGDAVQRVFGAHRPHVASTHAFLQTWRYLLSLPGSLLCFLGSLFFFWGHGRFLLLRLDIFMLFAHAFTPRN